MEIRQILIGAIAILITGLILWWSPWIKKDVEVIAPDTEKFCRTLDGDLYHIYQDAVVHGIEMSYQEFYDMYYDYDECE